MAYPAVMAVLAVGVTIFLLTYILPKFEPLFTRKGVKLPTPTIVMMAASDVLLDYWYLWLAGAVGLVLTYVFGRKHRAGPQDPRLAEDQPADRRADVPQGHAQPQRPHAGHDGRQRRVDARRDPPDGRGRRQLVLRAGLAARARPGHRGPPDLRSAARKNAACFRRRWCR